MISRVVVPVGMTLIAAPIAASTVHAAEEDKGGKTLKIKPSELPIYGEPIPAELEFIPEPTTRYRESVSSIRKSVWSATEGMQGGIDNFKSGVALTKEFAQDFKKKVREDSGVLQRAGLITVAGLGGVVAGYKGGFMRKTLLASAAMTTAAAICYPNQAVDMSGAAWGRVKEESFKIYQDVKGGMGTKQEEPKKLQEIKKETEHIPSSASEKAESNQKPDVKLDHGQSNKEDKDMYTTRS